MLEIIGGDITRGGRFIVSVTSGYAGRRRRVGLRISCDPRRDRSPVGRSTAADFVLNLVGRTAVRGRNPVGPTQARDPNRVGRITARGRNPVGRMVARDRNRGGRITARGRNPVVPTQACDPNRVGRITARGRNPVVLTQARDRNRVGLITPRGRSPADLIVVRRIDRRRQVSGPAVPMRGRPAPIDPTNVHRSRNDRPGDCPGASV